MLRLAANLGFMFTESPLMERFGRAAQVGFRAVELLEPYDEVPSALRSQLDRHGLVMLGVNTRAGETAGCAALPGREAQFAREFADALRCVSALGGGAIHCLAGTLGGKPDGTAMQVFVANLRLAADLAAGQGITVLIEPLNPRDRPGYALNTVEQAADVIASVGRPNVKIQFDFYHLQISGGDLLTRFQRHLPLIGHVQIAAVPSRAEPDEGEINYPAIFEAIDRSSYAGWVACEYRPRGGTEAGLGWARPFAIGRTD